MRIALVHMRHARTGGTERYLNALASELCERGHETTIVCRSRDEAPHPDARFVLLHRPALGSAGRMLAFARAVEEHAAEARYDLVVGLGKTYTHDVIRLGGGCHETYLEKAHEHTLTPLERVLRTDRRKHRLALEIEARALAPDAYRQVIVNSEMVARDVTARYAVPPERLTKIPNGVDLERFRVDLRAIEGKHLRSAWGVAEDAPIVGFLGTGYGRKGLDRLLAAFPSLLAARPDARLVIAGRDARPQRFERQADDLGIAHTVRFLGKSDRPEHVFAACDVYALPTRYDTFALTILEALAAGCPVLTTVDAGGSEVIDEGVHGAVLDEACTPEALGEAMVHWTDRGRIEAARASCRERAERYPKERTARETAELLEQIGSRSKTT